MKILAAFAVAAFATTTFAQTATLQNGGFEQLCYFCGGPFPEGWSSPGSDPIARRRAVGDGESPAFFPVGTPAALTPHTGVGFVAVGTNGSGGFEGLTTDSRNFCYCDQTCQTACASPFPYFDPLFDYNGGDVVVSVWYMIPANDPITDVGGMRLDVKTLNQDVATKDVFNTTDGGFTGHTNGEWRQMIVLFSRAEIQEKYECNTGARPDCGCACVPTSPLPDRIKVTFGRFVGDGEPTTGTIFFDDLQYTQLPAVAVCDSDFNCDGNSDQDDVGCIINVVAGNPGCECQDPDFNRDGNVDQDDVAALINVVAGGPCP